MNVLYVVFGLMSLVFTCIGLLFTWNGIQERRLNEMLSYVEKRMKDKQDLNEAAQSDLKDDVKRLETKIDMLIELQLKKIIDSGK